MISILNEHFLILATFVLFCYGITYKLSRKLKFSDISKPITTLALLALVSTMIILVIDLPVHTVKFNSLFVKDYTSSLIEFMMLCIAIGIILTTFKYNLRERIPQFEFTILVLCITISTHLLVTVEEIFALYLILEFQSICMCILVAIKKDNKSTDASIKTLIVGSIASAILLGGLSLLYSVSGGLTFFEELSIFFKSTNPENISYNTVYIAIILISIGIFFKIYIAPLHLWISDIYALSPSSSLLIYATTSSLPMFFVLHKIYVGILANYSWFWEYIINITCLTSILVGTIGAIYQSSIKRMLAYSSIANAGYIYLSFLSYESAESIASGIFYLIIYTLNIFGMLSLMMNVRFKEIDGTENTLENTEQLAGLYHKNSVLSYTIMIYSYTMAGLPPLSFFFSKISIFTAIMMNPGYMWLIVAMAIATSVAVFYYIRMIQLMYFDKLKNNNSIRKIPFIVLFITFLIITINILLYIYSTQLLAMIMVVALDMSL